MKLSVIVPVYNVEDYLEESINSLLNQSKTPYEIILVDDGSTDNSGFLCDKYAAIYDYIRVIHKANAGLGMARNSGLEVASGNFVLFLDSDDYFDEDLILNIFNAYQNKKYDLYKTGLRNVDVQGKEISLMNFEDCIYTGAEIKECLLPRIIGSSPIEKDSIPMSSCCTAYSMEIIKRNNIWFRSEREYISEDVLFNIEYMMHCERAVLSSYVGYNYRYNPGSLTRVYRPDRFEQCIRMFNCEKLILQENEMYNLCKYRLDRQLFIYVRSCIRQLRLADYTRRKKYNLIRTMCVNDIVVAAIKEYPYNKLGIKQRMFIICLKYRMAMVLYRFS